MSVAAPVLPPHTGRLGVPEGEHSTRGNSPAEGEARRDSPSPRAEHSTRHPASPSSQGRAVGRVGLSPPLPWKQLSNT